MSRPVARHAWMAPAGAVLSLAAAWLPIAARAHASSLRYPELSAASTGTGPWYTSDRVVVRLRAEISRAAWAELPRDRSLASLRAARPSALQSLSARAFGAWFEPEFRGARPGMGDPDLSTFWIAHLPRGVPLESSMSALQSAFEVEEASPNAVVAVENGEALEAATRAGAGQPLQGSRLTSSAPSDSMWSLCYWLYQSSRRDLHALEAWDITRGDPSVVMAIIDTGVLPYHPDLGGSTAGSHGNMWVNQAEMNGLPGVDDDGNGYVDDIGGWDFVALDSAYEVRPGEDWQDADNDPNDFAVHGTAVSGIAGAIANNGIGIPGVAPGCRIMALRAGYSSPIYPPGLVDMGWASQAIVYAVQNGASVINCSFENVQQPDLIAAASFATRNRVTIVVAAGNNGTQNYLGHRDDVVSVGATDQNDKLTLFSNPGTWVSLSAPGQTIPTTTLTATGTDSIGLRTPSYSAGEAGTSFSSPMVTGAVGLLQSARLHQGLPPLHPYLVQLRLKETADDISALNPSSTGYGAGRLNLYRMLTDPPGSTGIPLTSMTVGSGVPLSTLTGRTLLAYVTADSALLLADPVASNVPVRLSLGAGPVGGLSAADFGPGLGICLFVALEDGRILGFRFGETLTPFWQEDGTPVRGAGDLYPALGDLDGDGVPEIVWGGDDGSVWAWRADGRLVTGFPRHIGAAGRNVRIALSDLDGRPGLEIIAATTDAFVHALRGDGSEMPGWPKSVGDIPGSPVVTRLGYDPAPAVVVAAGLGMHAFRADGTLRFDVSLPSVVAQDPAVGDLDGNGLNEIVVATAGPYTITTFDSAGVVVAQKLLTTVPDGPPIVGPLTSGSGAQVIYAIQDNQGRHQLQAATATLADLRGWPKPGHPGGSPTLADVNGDGRTDILAGSGADSVLYLYNAGAATWRATAALWPTARGNYARTGSAFGAPGLGTVDDQGPDSISNLSASAPGTHDVTLHWNAPFDPGSAGPKASVYDVRVSTAPIDPANFALAPIAPGAPAPAAPGVAQQMTVGSLAENSSHWFAMRAQDADGNWGAISNTIEARTGNDAPAPVADLKVTAGSDSTITLGWTASGDDGVIGRPAFYRVRYSEAPLDSAAFAVATLGEDVPAVASGGQPEHHVLRGLPHGHRVWVAMRAVDAAGNVSGMSNQVATFIGRLATRTGVALIPSRQPSAAPVAIEWQGDPAYANQTQTIYIFDVSGREVRGYTLPRAASGIQLWDGLDLQGFSVRSGVYFARLTSGPTNATTRLVLLR